MYRILAQHKDFMVINKGPGLGMHDETDEAGLLHPGLVSRVKADTGLLLYPVHRLDKMTSGLVLLAHTTEANRALSMAFAAREVSKQYLALSDRKPKKKQGWVKGDMQKGRGGSWMLTRTLDNPAISWFDSVSVREGLRLYRIKPQTGKTHQIRVALKSVGAPILGDERYGGTAADRGYLHAWRLAFTLAGEAFDFVCPPDEGTLFVLPELHAAIAGLAE
ncbi:TPA: TIGR01621 family pseudouridine synthase [Aeromonas hydrophila]|uniref:TIGR01621 family pseudouridine synthase n=1 Tax=Aeromonas hydrophila TaxID=644 RepID=UPI001A23EFD9|nr:TIGR01621 family pseudouridine synthase [Aeromonas hydrophila]UBQ51158.1 TIGR01621 family pseudouridine synthase [Aeromonas hydrophila]HAU4889571.1 TIGR01621 family pseudouridine synthase [Aeromonas hydrophila]HDI1214040.1 TIGR01621 family pseudouridine synthase [Aeromonas hydrophila]